MIDLDKMLYVENAKAWEEALSKKRFSTRKLEVKVVERGIILPQRRNSAGKYEGGVLDNDFNFIAGFARTPPTEKFRGGLVCR